MLPFAGRSPTVLAAVLWLATSVGQQSPAPIRTGVVLVPLDVRVVDVNGEPITDLTAADFTVYENGIRQEIVHFMPLSFADSIHTGRFQLRTLGPLAGTANGHRTFILILGRGRLNGPVNGIDSLIGLVRSLIPTDRVGVVAYLRASEPSTDHAAVIRFLERYRDRHEDLEGRLRSDFRHGGFSLVALSAGTRTRIDAFFESDGIPTFTDLPGAAGTTASRYIDLNYLRRTIQVARRLPGEKHVVVLTEKPLPLGRTVTEDPDNHVLVKWANEARAALSYINTGGLSGHTMIRGQVFISRGAGGQRDSSAMGVTDREFFAPGDHRAVAERTGGLSAFYQDASTPLADLDRTSRFQYLLGYYPSVAASPESYRTIRVVLHRQGATARYRHGYRMASAPDDEKQFRDALAEDSLQSALAGLAGAAPRTRYAGARVATPSLRIRSTSRRDSETADELAVTISFDPTRVAFTLSGNAYKATLRLAVLVDDDEGRQIGELARSMDLVLSTEEHARAKKDWLSVDVMGPLQGNPARVRAATYDYAADRTMAAASAVESPRR